MVIANNLNDRKGTLNKIGGSQSDHWNNTLGSQVVQALWINNSDAETRDKQISATVAALMMGTRWWFLKRHPFVQFPNCGI